MMETDASGKTAAELLGVMNVPTVGRDRLVATAVELYYHNGFNSIGIDQILAQAGVTKTTFYKHFESKDDLVVAALRMRDEWETQAWMRAVQELGGDDPYEQLLAMFDVLDKWFNAPEYGGCIFLNAAVEYPNPSDPIHQVAAEHKRKFWEWINTLSTQAGCSDPTTFADTYTMTFEGALVMRHVHGRNDAAAVAKKSVQRMMQAFFPETQ